MFVDIRKASPPWTFPWIRPSPSEREKFFKKPPFFFFERKDTGMMENYLCKE